MALDSETKKYVDDTFGEVTKFSTRKLGDTPTDVQQLTPKGYVDQQDASIISVISSVVSSITGSTVTPVNGLVFGDSSDGVATFDGTNAYPFASIVLASSIYSLTRDVYATVITISSIVTVKPSGYILYASSVLTNNGIIDRRGGPALLNVAPSALSSGHLPGAPGGVNGSGGGGGGTPGGGGNGSPGANGVVGTSVLANSHFSSTAASGGSAGQGGGAFPASGGSGGIGGNSQHLIIPPKTPYHYETLLDTNMDGTAAYYTAQAGSGSGGGGGGGGGLTTSGGGGATGGGSGGSGGIIAIFARVLQNNAFITAQGGAGGNGFNGSNGTGSSDSGGGGGGGGAGGSGGVIIYVTTSLTNNGTMSVLGGSGGSGGNGGAPGGGGGSSGTNGNNAPDNFGRIGSIVGILI